LHTIKDNRNDDFRGTNLEVARANVQIARYFESRGRYDEADELYKRALEGMEKLLGNDHPDTLSSRNNLAIIYWLQGRMMKLRNCISEL
jgi:tetratricopeptide (TPR) repeat protein